MYPTRCARVTHNQFFPKLKATKKFSHPLGAHPTLYKDSKDKDKQMYSMNDITELTRSQNNLDFIQISIDCLLRDTREVKHLRQLIKELPIGILNRKILLCYTYLLETFMSEFGYITIYAFIRFDQTLFSGSIALTTMH